MPTVNQRVRSGNRVVVLLGGVQVGLMQSCEMNDDYSPEPASGIGDIHVQEYVPTMARHSLSCQSVVLRRRAMLEAGVAPENGDATLEGLVFDIAIHDKDTGIELRKYKGCSYASGNISVSAHRMVMQSAMFLALDVEGVMTS
ncbi:hypothetical protein UFOVP326_11 [uncultured Caudovirales phage]|uniref:Uncharacterized protein n=1 Tax=uncultured Caudovirales phage TaxID=2100421 RepID=A0A6J5LZL5_9CAUD|nr:hypothetical protein UFOVP326_11 [uncultured Caudovirales phage]